MTVEKKRNFIINCIYALLLIAILYVVMKYLLGIVLPFLIGFAIAFALRPLVELLERKTGKKGRFWSAAVLILTYAVVGTLLFLACWKGISELSLLMQKLPEVYSGTIGPAVDRLTEQLAAFAGRFSPELHEDILAITQSTSQMVGRFLSTFSGAVVDFLTAFATKIPSVLVACAFTIISSVFFCLDYERITRFIKRQVPERHRHLITQLKGYVVGTFWKMARAYLIIMGITFLELLIGLSLLGVDYPATVAAATALVDILPVLGTGVVLLPWVLVELLRGHYFLAVGLGVLYAVIGVVRNFLEPKIVGKQIGLHPVVTLMALYVGARLFGFVGLFLPVVVIVLKNLNDTGVIRLWKE